MIGFDVNVESCLISPLSLAYIGDSVYEVYIRSFIMKDVNMPVNKLHKIATKYVSATSQAKIYHKIEDKLTPEEINIFKRGRNAHSYTSAKNANIIDYRTATGLEALIGYIYVKKDKKRLDEIMNMCVEVISNEE